VPNRRYPTACFDGQLVGGDITFGRGIAGHALGVDGGGLAAA
jgi:hypothetical protein